MALLAALLVLAGGPARAQDPVVVACDADFPPFSHAAPHQPPEGILVDLWRLWSDKTGRPVRFMCTDAAAARAAVTAGNADVHAGLWLAPDAAPPLVPVQPPVIVGVLAVHVPATSGARQLTELADGPIGVRSGGPAAAWLRANLPDRPLATFDSQDALIQAVLTGEVPAIMAEETVLANALVARGRAGALRPLDQPHVVQPIVAALAPDRTALADTVRTGLSEITPGERAAVLRHSLAPGGDGIRLSWPAGIGLGAFVLVALLLAWIWHLRRTIAQRRQIEAELRESRQLFATFMNHLPVIASLKDGNGRILYANAACNAFHGRTVTGLTSPELYPDRPDLVDLVAQADRAVLAGEQVAHVSRTPDRDGTEHVLQTLKFRVPQPDGPSLIGTFVVDITERVGSEERLSRALAELEALLDNSLAGIARVRDGRVIQCNDRAADMFGLDRDDLMARPFPALFPGQGEHDRFMAEVRTALARKGAVHLDQDLIRADGRTLSVLIHAKSVGTGSGDQDLVFVLVDVSDQRRAEQAVRDAERRLARLLENVADIVYTLDDSGRFTFLSSRARDHLGHDPDRLIGTPLTRLVHPDDQDRVRTRIDEALAGTGADRPLEFRARRADGAWVWLSTTPTGADDADGRRLVSGVAANIDSRKRTEEALKDARDQALLAEARQRQILDTAGEAIISLDQSGVIETFNPAAEAMFGYGRDEVVGADAAILLPPDGTGAHPDVFRRRAPARDDAGPESRQTEGRRRNGETFPIDLTVTAFTFQDRTRHIAVIRDITEWRRNQDSLARAKAEAEAASRAKSDFLASMSHEIRTPMNAILGMLELLRLGGAETDRDHALSVMADSANALLRIIDDILDLSRIEAGRMEIESVPFDLGDLVEGVTDMLAPRAREKGLELVCALDPALADRRIGDPVRLRQVLFNLVGNAVKFTEHGRVTVSVNAQAPEDESVTFEVSDTGIGIAPAHLDRLFEPFTQGDPTIPRRFGGSGLGLSICQRLVQLMGGDITVESTPAVGSIFRVRQRLPVRQRPLPAARPLDGLGVLVVEDSAFTREALRQILAAAGAEVILAPSAEAARSLLRTAGAAAPAALVLDQDLPGMSGLELIRRLGEEGAPCPPALILTRHDPGVLTATAHQLAVGPVLAKPVRRRALVDAVAGLAGRQTPAAGPESHVQPAYECPDRRTALAAGTLILVAEDNETNRTVLERQLRRLGYAADLVVDGAAAWEALDQGAYGLLITDCHMPHLDGFQLTERLRAAEQARARRRHLPVVALTALALPDEAERCLAAGMDGYLTKPVSLARLDAVIREHLPAAARLRRPVQAAAPQAATLQSATPQTPPPAENVLDHGFLQEAFGDAPDLLRTMLLRFLETSRPNLDHIATALDQADATEVARHAHSLAGAAFSAGARRLAHLCASVERAAGDGDLAQAREFHDHLAPAFDEVEKEVQGL